MNICIIGAGSLGGLFGAYLSNSGEDVTLLDIDTELVAAIERDGLQIRRDGEDLHAMPDVTTDSTAVPDADVVFVFVKAMHTTTAIRNATDFIGEDTIVVTVQNGLTNMDVLSRELPQNRLVGGITLQGAQLESPATIRETGTGTTKIGGEDADAVETVAQLLDSAGLSVETVSNPRKPIWNKQIVSVGTKPVASLTGLPDGPLSECSETATAMEALIREAVSVAKAHGIDIQGDPIESAYELCQQHYETKPSMLVDIENERPTEIDYINGAIVDYAEEYNIEVPYNRLVTQLIKGNEYRYLEFDTEET